MNSLARPQKESFQLQNGFRDISHLLALKNEIKSDFKEYVADLKYDLQIYKKLFDELDSTYKGESEKVNTSIQEMIILTEGPNFRRFFEEKLDELKSIVDDFTWKEHQLHTFYFRNQLWDLIHCCPFTSRATLKPRGYAGDFELMKMIYLNNYQGKSTYAKLTHKHAVEHTASNSVRNRIELIAKLLDNHQKSQHLFPGVKTKVLSVGCGPAFELQNILQSHQDCEKYSFALFDQDTEALSEAAKIIKKIVSRLRSEPKVNYVRGSVRTMLFSRKFKQKWGQFNFIYSLGLFDYLSTRIAKAVLERLFQFLKPGGDLVVGNFHVSNPSKYYMAYWGGWHLVLRTEEELTNLFHNQSTRKCSVIYDGTGIQMFLCIKKDGEDSNR
jgi:extracellular factor (EF) 3-hydroxypalmitic acid methyl ester biosynthesis protein